MSAEDREVLKDEADTKYRFAVVASQWGKRIVMQTNDAEAARRIAIAFKGKSPIIYRRTSKGWRKNSSK